MYRGVKLLHDPVRNKGTAFTEAERAKLRLAGLLPLRIHSIAEQEQRRERGAAYDSLIEEFIEAVQIQFPGVLTQLEDFGNSNAFRLLAHYRDRACLFDDDIQGAGAVGLAGILSALRITREKLEDQRFLFCGAGQASIGIASTVVAELVEQGVAVDRARQCCWF